MVVIAIAIALMDKTGLRTLIPKEEILNPKYDYYLEKYKVSFFDPEVQPPHYQINLQVTSEIGSSARFSFLQTILLCTTQSINLNGRTV